MAASYTPTSTYSNLESLELEQLRRADFWTNGKALTVGDDGAPPYGVVGKGDVNAEPYFTGPSLPLDDIYTITPPANPGNGLSTTTHVAGVPSETVSWFGPDYLYDGNIGYANLANRWRDPTPGLNFTLFVLAGDLVLVKYPIVAGTTANQYAVGRVSAVLPDQLGCSQVFNPNGAVTTQFDVDPTAEYPYVIVRPNVAQLLAVPGSGPLGQEQTFMMVQPGTPLHNDPGPTIDQINAVRIQNVVPPHFGADSSVDRSDGVFPSPGPFQSLDKLGYRVILYPDVGDGSGPNLAAPIAQLNPVIDGSIAPDEQRMTMDFQAGLVRFSVAPATGDDIKPAGASSGTNPLTGRLNLYAVYWAVDQSLTEGGARSLYEVRGTETEPKGPARMYFDVTTNAWHIGADSSLSLLDFYVKSLPQAEESPKATEFGTQVSSGTERRRYFVYRPTEGYWRMLNLDSGIDSARDWEVGVGDKHALSVGDGANPPKSPGADQNPVQSFTSNVRGIRKSDTSLKEQLVKTAEDGFGKLHLRKGHFYTQDTLFVPPGVVIEGEGQSTTLHNISGETVLRFGPNTDWGVYDLSADGPGEPPAPSTMAFADGTAMEGIGIVWNPTRRVWGIVQADATGQAIWFNEMSTDGSMLYSGAGVDLKNSATPLFTSSSFGAGNHTSGHYPRIAYNKFTNEYAVIWVEDGAGSSGIQLKAFELFDPATDPTINVNYTLGAISSSYRDHPSLAYNETDPADADLRVLWWWTSPTFSRLEAFRMVGGAPVGILTHALANKYVVSSTDIGINEDGYAVFVWSERDHALLTGTLGTITDVGGGTRELSDASGVDFANEGVTGGSKFLHLNVTGGGNGNGGTDGVVWALAPLVAAIKPQNTPHEITYAAATNVHWAIVPQSRIQVYYEFGGGTPLPVAGAYENANTAIFNPNPREPDFVRISRGENQWIIAFQAFNTTGFLARDLISNFDDGHNAVFIDVAGAACLDQTAQREHLGVCYVILSTNLAADPMYPRRAAPTTYAATTDYMQQVDRPIELASMSAGASDPLVPRPNAMWMNWALSGGNFIPFGKSDLRGYNLEISARHLLHPWSMARAVSLIPDVAWTGSDWAIVSPTRRTITSPIGTFRDVAGQQYVVDPTFYFGNSGSASDGNYLLPTVEPFSNSLLYVVDPITGPQYIDIIPVSEHVALMLGGAWSLLDGDRMPWTLVSIETRVGNWHLDSGIKNMGIRVDPEGRLIMGASRLTDSHDVELNNVTQDRPDKVQTVSRRWQGGAFPTFSSGGGNGPITFGDREPGENIYDLGTGWDWSYPTTRIAGHLGFRGVCPGAPKGYNERAPFEVPQVAMAWGENFYALVDRNISGSPAHGGTVNETVVYRQSFGPYRSGAESLNIHGLERRTPGHFTLPKHLTVKSKHNVFTRHGFPATPTAGFDTDGYRNCFVYPSMVATPIEDPTFTTDLTWTNMRSLPGSGSSNQNIHLRMMATYTDAKGGNPLEVWGPEPKYDVGTGHFSTYVQDGWTGTDTAPLFVYDPAKSYQEPSSPKVIWDGQRFAAFWTESQRNEDPTFTKGAHTNGGNICMAFFPGDDAVGNIDSKLTTARDSFEVPEIADVVRVSCGNIPRDVFGITAYPHHFDYNQIYVCDAAFSGKSYAVVWVAGMNSLNTDTLRSGSALGIAIFDGAGSSSNYLLATTNTQGQYSNPKILWDGKQFVIVAKLESQPLSPPDPRIYTWVVPELGIGNPTQVRRLAAESSRIAGSFSVLGNVGVDASSITQPDYISFTGIETDRCQPGDILVLTKSKAGAIDSFDHVGWHVVKDYDMPNQRIYLDIYDLSSIAGNDVFGSIISGGLASNRQQLQFGDPFISDITSLPPSGTNYDPTPLDERWLDGDTVNAARVLGFVYNDVDDEYALLYITADRITYLAIFKREGFNLNRREAIRQNPVSLALAKNASLGWNGRHYLVVGDLDGSESPWYALYTAQLAFVEAEQIADHFNNSLVANPQKTVIGRVAGTVPGALYGDYAWSGDQTWFVSQRGRMQARLKKSQIKWNDKMGRWIVSASYLWALEGYSNLARGYSFQNWGWNLYTWYNAGGGPSYDWPVTSWVGNTLFGMFITPLFQPGTRIVFRNQATGKVGGVMTILRVGGVVPDPAGEADYYGNITVDVNFADADLTMRNLVQGATPGWFFISTREDVICWTLGYDDAAVKLQDADSCYLDDVEISGKVVDIEETYPVMARPTWRNAGQSVGSPLNITNENGIQHVLNYSRSLLSPDKKVETLRLTNVRSRTATKYGHRR